MESSLRRIRTDIYPLYFLVDKDGKVIISDESIEEIANRVVAALNAQVTGQGIRPASSE